MCTDIYCQICLVLKHSQINEEWKHLIRCYPFTNKFIQFNNQKFTIKCSSNSKMCFIITWLPHYKISINATPVYIRNEKWNTYTSINDGLIDHIWLIRLNWMIKLIKKTDPKEVPCLESENYFTCKAAIVKQTFKAPSNNFHD